MENHDKPVENETRKNEEKQFTVYTRRWLVMFVVFLLNVSNGAVSTNLVVYINMNHRTNGTENSDHAAEDIDIILLINK